MCQRDSGKQIVEYANSILSDIVSEIKELTGVSAEEASSERVSFARLMGWLRM